MELMGLATALYNLGMTVVNDATREKGPAGARKQVVVQVYVHIPKSQSVLRLILGLFMCVGTMWFDT